MQFPSQKFMICAYLWNNMEMSNLLLHMSPEAFPGPRTFDPDRWVLEASTSKMGLDFAPFSKGPRIWYGRTLPIDDEC
ncbi:hypothetical protein C8J55DRAFT_571964 [Lentinula edodes]|uniref:Cytochrome P450 n=1 Tax=Lentinula lateritia TaxID=40482 RepID=A0A9W9DT45_9AGAR|nr:hypothetical protein C8J55DRAFT_571964 [Lentinula edodes]